MKCDSCKNRKGYTLSMDECGAGNVFTYCKKGHWDDDGPRDEDEEKMWKSKEDPWEDCIDFECL